jgi:predicted metal-binding protein
MEKEVIYGDGSSAPATQQTAVIEHSSPTVPPAVPQWDEFDFRKRFTRDERKAILAATKVSADVEDFEAMLKAAGRTGTMIKSNDALLIEAMALLEDAGLIAEGRANEILGKV